MKLWTLQHRELIASAADEKLVATWDRTPQNWRAAYRWMAAQWQRRMGARFDSAPIWCWHSCDGRTGSPPTVGTASMLMGDWNYYACSTVLIEINVPDHLCLLSSYSMWNVALEEFIENKRDTIDDRFDSMFDEPLIKHESDDVQAVIPWIMTEWIVDVRDLPKTNDDWGAWV